MSFRRDIYETVRHWLFLLAWQKQNFVLFIAVLNLLLILDPRGIVFTLMKNLAESANFSIYEVINNNDV